MPSAAEHIPHGSPLCSICGKPSLWHRVEHRYAGQAQLCARCGLPATHHRRERQRVSKPKPVEWWGLDGEGQGRISHRYTLLAAVDETGSTRRFIEAPDGGRLSTVQCLEFLLSLPYPRLFAYSFNYDLTMMLKDLDTETLYKLFHEDKRPRTGRTLPPIVWKQYVLNLERTKFTLTRLTAKSYRRKVIIWDIWKFFQSKFTKAISDWSIGTPDEVAEIEKMKEQRSEFDKLDREQVREYCFSECAKIGQLAHKLTGAHIQAGLKLRNYYGAGSTGSAILVDMGIRKKRGVVPEPMTFAVAHAFFGGRFENAVLGGIPGPVYSYDISSAYPYQLFNLPCMVHGTWYWTYKRSDLDSCKAALVRYKLGEPKAGHTWGPFPFRLPDGSIAFPIKSGGGFVYKDEYLAGERLFPHVQFHGAFILRSDCDCRPFEKIPHYYRERAKLGNDAAGIVLKLGPNSVYGKLAQSVGETAQRKPPFQQWIWAGMITSGTRAQILDAMSRLSSPDQLLMVATDGIYTREPIDFPLPSDTGTYDTVDSKTGETKPLGGWTSKTLEQGVFCARPGIYFPLDPTKEQIKEVRGRGIGKSIVLECWRRIVEAFDRGKMTLQIDSWENERGETERLSRFVGGKNGTWRVGPDENGQYEYRRSPRCGQWVYRPIKMSFDPLPKREKVCDDGVSLELRVIDGISLPYSRAVGRLAPEAIMLQAAQLEADEQPDGGDMSVY